MSRLYPILPTSRLAIRVLPGDISRRVFTRILKLFNKSRGNVISVPCAPAIINTRINNASDVCSRGTFPPVYLLSSDSHGRSICSSKKKKKRKKVSRENARREMVKKVETSSSKASLFIITKCEKNKITEPGLRVNRLANDLHPLRAAPFAPLLNRAMLFPRPRRIGRYTRTRGEKPGREAY